MKTYKFKLMPTHRFKFLHALIDTAAEIWNWCIEQQRENYKATGKKIGKFDLIKSMTQAKNEMPHWRFLNSTAIQQIADRIEASYRLFFTRLKSKQKASPPKFRKRSKYKSITFKHSGWKIQDNVICIQGVQFRFWKSREVEGKIKTVTVKRNVLGEFYIFIVTDKSDEVPIRQGNISVGMDFGLKTFLTLSDSTEIESPQFFKQGINSIRKASKQLSKKKKGSNNRFKAICNLFRKHEKIANQREDWFWKLSHWLCDRYDVICIEDLNLKAMQRLWGRKISDLSFAKFVQILEVVCKKRGVRLVKIDRFFASSKICNVCGHKNESLSLSDRVWTCKNCGIEHN